VNTNEYLLGPYLLDVRCDKACVTPVSPFSQAKKEWHDAV